MSCNSQVTILGGGRSVGKSAVLVTIWDVESKYNILFDSGGKLDMKDESKFPDFKILIDR